jgi:2,4-dienoyl-CoA reductase-like NADH-dependent reductase (Old Yellow Enzyme family)
MRRRQGFRGRGGSGPNRARFPLNLVAIMNRAGRAVLVSFRISSLARFWPAADLQHRPGLPIQQR